MLFNQAILTKLREFMFPVKRDCIVVWFKGKPVIRQYKKPLKNGMGMTRKDAEKIAAFQMKNGSVIMFTDELEAKCQNQE